MEESLIQDEPIKRSIKIVIDSIENIVRFFFVQFNYGIIMRKFVYKIDCERRNWHIVYRDT